MIALIRTCEQKQTSVKCYLIIISKVLLAYDYDTNNNDNDSNN